MHPHRIHEQILLGLPSEQSTVLPPFPSSLVYHLTYLLTCPRPYSFSTNKAFRGVGKNQQKQQSSLPAVGAWKVCSPYHCSLCPSALSGEPLLLPPPIVVAVSFPHGPPWPSLQHSLLHSQFATWAPSPRPDWELLENKAVCLSPSTAPSVAGAR